MYVQKSTCSLLSKQSLGTAMVYVPKLSLKYTSRTFICATFLADLGINDMLNRISIVFPLVAILKQNMVDKDVDVVLIEKEEITEAPILLMCDKGEGGKKRDGASFVKLAERFEKNDKRVKVCSIRLQSVGNFSLDVAQELIMRLRSTILQTI